MELFKRRMENISPEGHVGRRLIDQSNAIQNKMFSGDEGYRKGMIYDWDMNPLEEVEFRFEKRSTYHAEEKEIEYLVQFRPNYNPEHKFKDLYFLKDGRERFGFYLDVYNYEKAKYEKWLIVGKDDRVAFDRYNVFKCNWCFEWIFEDVYYKSIGCVREATDSSFNSQDKDKLGGTTVDGEFSLLVPTNKNSSTILLGQKFIISDNLRNPQTYAVSKIKDTTPLGVTRAFMKQRVFNPHTDYCGEINSNENLTFKFDLPIENLPDGFGGPIHMIADCIVERNDKPFEQEEESLFCEADCLYIGGTPVKVYSSVPVTDDSKYTWFYQIDHEDIGLSKIKDYFEFVYDENCLTVKAVSDVMAKYILTIALKHNGDTVSSVDLEVKL